MKIDPSAIIRDHLGTLRNDKTGRVSVADLLLFYGGPLAAGGIAYALRLCVDREVHSVSITFFGIFVALLLNIQVAVFGILQRKHEPPKGNRSAEEHKEKLELRRTLLSQVNANISYLVLFCCLALFVFLIFYIFGDGIGLSGVLTAVIYSHFLLILLMVVKRSHALFQSEYQDAVDHAKAS